MSTREVKQLQLASPAVGKSNAARLWQAAGSKFVAALGDKGLAREDWAILLLDGTRLSQYQLAVVAVSISASGEKQVLNFERGGSENSGVCRGLLRSLDKRGFACSRRLFAVLDWSDALKPAIVAFFPDAVIQRCLVHKERNFRGKCRIDIGHAGESVQATA